MPRHSEFDPQHSLLAKFRNASLHNEPLMPQNATYPDSFPAMPCSSFSSSPASSLNQSPTVHSYPDSPSSGTDPGSPYQITGTTKEHSLAMISQAFYLMTIVLVIQKRVLLPQQRRLHYPTVWWRPLHLSMWNQGSPPTPINSFCQPHIEVRH